MQLLKRDELTLGGFAGLTEHRLVTDSRLFGARKRPETFEGIGHFVYLADARFNPKGETGMHPHKEIDVISVMVDGRVSHGGSLEHGKSLEAGDVQVQRAGGEGFSHNEMNPDDAQNRLLQLWVLPETAGERAAYKYYTPKQQGVTRIYGGDKQQDVTFDSHTIIDMVKLGEGESYQLEADALVYIIKGEGQVQQAAESEPATEGLLVRGEHLRIEANQSLEMFVVQVNQ